MNNKKKVIGVCVTKIHDQGHSDLVNQLHYHAQLNDYKLLIFNSFVDFYNNDRFDEGAKSIYDIINFDIVDALVILDECFFNKDIVKNIISRAKEKSVPVITVDAEYDGCFSIIANIRNSYKEIIRHVICDHGAKDTFYIAGLKYNDPSSVERIDCYKEALEECGLEFNDSMVAYGEYWDGPARKIVGDLIRSGNKIPQAIFCANDYMAFAACEELSAHGYKVPDDVIVVGFDGVTKNTYFSPQLTTCIKNVDMISKLCVETTEKALNENYEPTKVLCDFSAYYSESCGCGKLSNDDYRKAAQELYTTFDEITSHEDFMQSWRDRVLEINDMNTLFNVISGSILEESYVCINSDFLASAMDIGPESKKSGYSDEVVVISSRYTYTDSDSTEKLSIKDIIPNLNQWYNDNTTYILNAIYVGNEVCGYYAVKSDYIFNCRNKIKRVLNTLNVAFNVAINHFREVKMSKLIEAASLTNPVTGLPNLKGTAKWFEEFSQKAESHDMALSISVYGLPKYTYIMENYGIHDVEDALRFVAESLKISNPVDCFIGHISEDEFAIINYYKDMGAIGDTINKATSVFFSVIEGYNTTSGKEYYVEVNCGCTVINPGWGGSLESFIKFANSEMYMNRLKSGTGNVIKEETTPKEHYKAFDLLIEKNLFNYHFQPIVNAKTGTIFGYEALMRTDASIGMTPLEVLATAREYNRLYEIERATMFNIMERYAHEPEKFGDCKVFINTIPGYFLNDDDMRILNDKYSQYMDKFVFELTEQDTISDNELNAIKRLSGEHIENQIAIDDYGTGHSNIVNLIRYTPQVIKIDRFLISEIDRNQNKQMFVRSTIEFAKINNIKVLAEGVETSNELKMVIDLGVDLIQGFYTGRPAYEPITSINEDIRKEILRANPLYGQDI